MIDIHSLDSVIPADFPRTRTNGIIARVRESKYGKTQRFDEFLDSWTAVVYRFSSCAEHDIAYKDSIHRVGGPKAPRLELYIQERELFGFFICGLAAIESFYYGCYYLASMLDNKNFPFNKPKSVQPSMTADKFVKFYAGDELTMSLDKLRNSNEYKDWSDVRNILAHRTTPARLHKVTLWPVRAETLHETTWIDDKIILDDSTTSSRRKWLAQTISDLMTAADSFTLTYFI